MSETAMESLMWGIAFSFGLGMIGYLIGYPIKALFRIARDGIKKV